jgi:hypothetical protein
MFKTNVPVLNKKFASFEIYLKFNLYCWYVDSAESLTEVKNLIIKNNIVNIWLSEEYRNCLKELYLMGANFIYCGNDILFFLDKSLITSGVLNPVDLGSMPFDLDVDLFVLHPVIHVEKKYIKALKQCKIESIYLNHSFWNDKIVEEIKEDEKNIKIYFHENVSKINSTVKKYTGIVSADKVLIYSTYLVNNLCNIKSRNVDVADSLEEFWANVGTKSYNFIFFESINDQKGLSMMIKQKISKIQKKAKILFLSSKQENNETFISKDLEEINQFILSHSNEKHYELNSFDSFLYSKEKLKACRISTDHMIISSNKFLNKDAISLLTVSKSIVKIYKNKIIGTKYYYWVHLDHLSEENFKNFTRFLDKTNNL